MNMPLSLVVLTLIVMYVANKKTFNPWMWLLAGSPLGLIVVALLPSADSKGTDTATCEKRRKRGNTAGISVSILQVIIALYLYVILNK